jgi:hypothetical protein
MHGVPAHDYHPHRPPPTAGGWLECVRDGVARVAAERGIDFQPMPVPVAAILPGLVDTVEQLAAGMDEQDRQWLAAALAALSGHVQLSTLPGPGPHRPD